MAMRFVLSQPALAPLFFAVGLGMVGSVGFGGYYLATAPDVIVNRKKYPSYRPELWALPNPQMAFKDASTDSPSKAKAVQKKTKSAIARRKLGKEESIAHPQ